MKIIMYHYVRPIKNSNYSNIKGLELKQFCQQLDFFAKNFIFLSSYDIIEIIYKGDELPINGIWLTFDDGYKDHFTYVLPELVKRNISATFFPPVQPIVENSLLDVNAIHFILASNNNEKELISELKNECKNFGIGNLEFNEFWNNIDKSTSRFDTKGVIFFKRMLQHTLDEKIRRDIVSKLFKKFVRRDIKEFSQELYLSINDIKSMLSEGMTFGNHTYSHPWLSFLNYEEQLYEIEKSLSFLKKLGVNLNNWLMCYPYGDYNKDTIQILNKLESGLAVTTKVANASLAQYTCFELPRYDTNDFIDHKNI